MQFIYISRAEMEAVASFIKHRGRVAIAELAAKSDTLIDLESKAAQLPADEDLFADSGPAAIDVSA
jgi:DDRGK domain-containing protein 1